MLECNRQSCCSWLNAGELELHVQQGAIFADTRWEPSRRVLNTLTGWKRRLPSRYTGWATAIYIQDTWDGIGHTDNLFTEIPVFVLQREGGLSLARRQCTRNYKISPIRRKVRELVGRRPRARSGPTVVQWIGISVDESHRMKESGVEWVRNRYPLVDLGMSRADCMRWFDARHPGRPLVKSSCVGCPFHSDSEWQTLAERNPEDMNRAIALDERLRSPDRPTNPNTKMLPEYLHKSGLPLAEVLGQAATPGSRWSANVFRRRMGKRVYGSV